MNYETKRLEELCTIKTGSPTGRAKKLANGEEGREVKVLLPKAMQGGLVIDKDLATETIGEVKEDNFTKEGDVILKMSTPFDSVYIDSDHEGILVTSFGMIIRKNEDVELDMRYLAMFLNYSQTNKYLQDVSMGATATMATLRRKTVADLEIPLPPLEVQQLLAQLSKEIHTRQAQYKELIELDKRLLNSQFAKVIWG